MDAKKSKSQHKVKIAVVIWLLKNYRSVIYWFNALMEFLAGVGAGTLLGMSLNRSVGMGVTWVLIGIFMPVAVKILVNALLKYMNQKKEEAFSRISKENQVNDEVKTME